MKTIHALLILVLCVACRADDRVEQPATSVAVSSGAEAALPEIRYYLIADT